MATDDQYIARIPYALYLERDAQQVVSQEVYTPDYQSLVAPTGGTFTLRDPIGQTVKTGAVTVVDSVAEFTLTEADLPTSLALGPGYRAVWQLDLPERARSFGRPAEVNRSLLAPVLTEAGLLTRHSSLRHRKPRNQIGYGEQLDEAWTILIGLLEEAGNRPNLIMSPSSLRERHMLKALALIYANFEDWTAADRYERMFSHSWRSLTFKWSPAEDDIAQPNRRQPSEAQVVTSWSPNTTRWKNL